MLGFSIISIFILLPMEKAQADDFSVVINEIMYNPDNCADSVCEYIELVNTGTVPVDVEGWEISDDSGTDTITAYHAGSPTVITPGGYAVITDNTTSVILEGGIHLAVDDASIGNGLDNSADTLDLSNGTQLIDHVTYNSADGADGNGSSLECANPLFENSNTNNGNWGESSPPNEYGTPGTQNSNFSGIIPPLPEMSTIMLLIIGLVVTGLIGWNRKLRLLASHSSPPMY